MNEAWFSIAGVNFVFISHGLAAEYLFDELPGLLPGFLIGKKTDDSAVCLVHFDHEKKCPLRFHSEPHLISGADSRLNEAIFTRLRKIPFTFQKNSSEPIGFLNGCLSFDARSNRGLIYIFCADEANNFVATLLKLLFVFTSLVMVNMSRLMVHGAGIKKGKGRGGYLFLGSSGAGKSTVSALSSGDEVLSDDATVIEVGEDACHIHATPFRQVGIGRSASKELCLEKEKLDMLIFLHQSEKTDIQDRDRRSAFAEILKEHLHCFEVMGELSRLQAFHLCRTVCEMIPSYDLYFRKDPGFWEHVMAL